MMRRLIVIALAVSSLVLASFPAQADASWQIAGWQYLVAAPGGGPAGYVGIPGGGPVKINEGFVHGGVGEIANRDRVPHTFTECVSHCESGTSPSYGTLFDIELPGGAVASPSEIDALNDALSQPGTYYIACRVHLFMRAKLTVNPV